MNFAPESVLYNAHVSKYLVTCIRLTKPLYLNEAFHHELQILDNYIIITNLILYYLFTPVSDSIILIF